MKRVAVLGTSGGISFAQRGFDSALRQVGMNTGNLMFQFAAWEAIANPKFTVDSSSDPAWIRRNADVLFIPAANQVNPAWDLEHWATFVERVDLPVVVVGLGAQAPIGSSANLDLRPGTRKFLANVSARAEAIGVRGAFTADVLATLGISNVEVTGCPSNFINPLISGETISNKLNEFSNKAAVKTCCVFGTMEPGTRDTEKALYQVSRAEASDVVYQTNEKILRTIFNRYVTEEDKEYFAWENAILSPGHRLEGYIGDVLKRGVFFSDARSWIDRAGKYDLVYGMRIHGNIAAIQGGGAGVCVAFDSRTLELAETMGYPFISAEKINSASRITLNKICEWANFSPSLFDRKRTDLRVRYGDILRASGIEASSTIFG